MATELYAVLLLNCVRGQLCTALVRLEHRLLDVYIELLDVQHV
jgi:hypothetical protein